MLFEEKQNKLTRDELVGELEKLGFLKEIADVIAGFLETPTHCYQPIKVPVLHDTPIGGESLFASGQSINLKEGRETSYYRAFKKKNGIEVRCVGRGDVYPPPEACPGFDVDGDIVRFGFDKVKRPVLTVFFTNGDIKLFDFVKGRLLHHFTGMPPRTRGRTSSSDINLWINEKYHRVFFWCGDTRKLFIFSTDDDSLLLCLLPFDRSVTSRDASLRFDEEHDTITLSSAFDTVSLRITHSWSITPSDKHYVDVLRN